MHYRTPWIPCDDAPVIDRARPVPWPRWGLALAGAAIGIAALSLARGGPAFAFAATSTVATVAELAAGWSAIIVGLLAWTRRPQSRFGVLLAGAGIAWFLVEWPNPESAGPLIFTAGLILRNAYAPILAHAALAFRPGRVGSTADRAIVAVAYATNLVLLGLVPAIAFDPAATGCERCPDNLVAIASNPQLAASVTRLGMILEVAWVVAAIVSLTARFARAGRASGILVAPVLLPAAVCLALVAADAVHSFPRASFSNDPLDLRLWYGQAAAITILCAGVLLEPLRARRARQLVAQFAVDLAASPPMGGLRDRLAVALGDTDLVIAYPLSDGRLSDGEGHRLAPGDETGRTITRVERGGEPVALVIHRDDLLGDPDRITQAMAAARLSLENERLVAETRSQLEDLRMSRARIVDAADGERRKLERDLHDGAQQRLVALSIALRLAQVQLAGDDAPSRAARLAKADREVLAALADLRDVAHGIYPAELADEGLAVGLAVLAEEAAIPIDILAVPDERLDSRVEAAAYFVITEATRQTGVLRASVSARLVDGRLVVQVDAEGPQPGRLVELEDRVGALDGTVGASSLPNGRVRLHAEIPCAS
jgi:signal transduction histidine kinase